jgi:nucleotide-binding universal stress UspA family protein
MSQRILVSVGDSSLATAALEYALAGFGDEEITVLHVIDAEEADDSIRQTVLRESFEKQRTIAEKAAERVLERVRNYADEYGVTLTTTTEYGNPAQEISVYAEENDIDRIIIGTHGRSGISRLLLGSIAETVMRRSPVPVTTVGEREKTPAPQ